MGAVSKWVVLHELVHLMTPDPFAPHGKEFCGVYLELVKRFIGRGHWLTLKAAFKPERVRYRGLAHALIWSRMRKAKQETEMAA